jgi:hypothetical protein
MYTYFRLKCLFFMEQNTGSYKKEGLVELDLENIYQIVTKNSHYIFPLSIRQLSNETLFVLKYLHMSIFICAKLKRKKIIQKKVVVNTERSRRKI